eukprot:jgi/Bigna1/80854/fgenesh1_pg.75_\
MEIENRHCRSAADLEFGRRINYEYGSDISDHVCHRRVGTWLTRSISHIVTPETSYESFCGFRKCEFLEISGPRKRGWLRSCGERKYYFEIIGLMPYLSLTIAAHIAMRMADHLPDRTITMSYTRLESQGARVMPKRIRDNDRVPSATASVVLCSCAVGIVTAVLFLGSPTTTKTPQAIFLED